MYDNVRFIFVFLNTMLFITFCLVGLNVSKVKSNVKYWRITFFAVLAYAFVIGLRWGRMIDWNLYCKRYQEIGEGSSNDDYELLFEGICYLFYNIGIPYWFFIFLQCALLMISLCLLFKSYKKEAAYIFPVVLYLVHTNENFIRWYLALTFILFAFYYVQINSYKKTIVLLICSVLVHVGTIVFSPFLFFKDLLNKKALNGKIAVLLLAFASFASLSQLGILTKVTQFALYLGVGGIDPKLGFWLESADMLVNGDLGTMGVVETKMSTQVRYFLEYFPILLYAPRYLHMYKYGNLVYNLTFLGVFLSPFFGMVEILGRISDFFLIFTAILGGITYYNVFVKMKTPIYMKAMCLFSLACAIWPAISFFLIYHTELNEMLFVWDSNGRDYLPFD